MRWRSLVVFLSMVLSTAAPGRAQTRELLDAPVARDRIRVQWDPSQKRIVWAIDSDTQFRELPADALFLTRRSVFVTYPKLNPLEIQATASSVAADDPSAAILSRLLDSLAGVAGLVKVNAAAAALKRTSTCDPVNSLFDDLYGDTTAPAELRKDYASWVKAIDDGLATHASGAQAVHDAVVLMTSDPGLIKRLDRILSTAPATLATIEEAAASPQPIHGCDPAILKVLLFTNPRARIQQVQALHDSVVELADLLRTRYAVPAKWNGLDYQISEEITPTADKMRSVTVKVADVSAKVDGLSSALAVTRKDVGAAAFTVRKYSSFAPEIGVGAVFGLVDRPKYGTALNDAGQTIVAKVPDDSISIQPSVLVNFVCRCAAGPLAPMFQIGASTSKELPGVLAGGGVRLFGAGTGDVALGAGAMFAWVKDLQKLSVNDVVSGTKDIAADLGYAARPRAAWYFVLQYKF